MKTKVLVATPLYEKQTGGPATVARFLEDHVAGEGWEVEVFSFESFMKYPSGLRHVLFAASLILRVWKSQVVVSLDPVSVGYPVMYVTRFLGKKYILRVPGDFAWEQAVARHGETSLLEDFVAKDPSKLPRDIQKLIRIQSEVAQSAQLVIAQTNFLKNIILSWGVDQERVVTVPNAFNSQVISSSQDYLREKLGITPDSKVCISVGRMIPAKGFEVLMSAFDNLQEENTHLLIVGKGPLREELEKKKETLAHGKNIHFLDYVENAALRAYIAQADLFVLNTSYEGISNVLLETMSLGTPIATTLEGGNRDWLFDGTNALIFPYNAQEEITKVITSALRDTQLREKVVSGGKETLKKFQIESVREAWQGLLIKSSS